MKKHILCMGDSNTHGLCANPSDSADGGIRFREDERWPRLLQDMLGGEYLVIEEGLSNRTTVFPDPLAEGLAAIDMIVPCLKSHEPVDLLILMLGTNDVKEYFSASAPCIALGLGRLVKKAAATECWAGGKPNILVVAPTPIDAGILNREIAETLGRDCVQKSRELAKEYRMICAQIPGVRFFDAGELGCELNAVDFLHLTRRGHAALAAGLAEIVPRLAPETGQ